MLMVDVYLSWPNYYLNLERKEENFVRNAAVAFEDFILYLDYNVGMQDKDRIDIKMNIG